MPENIYNLRTPVGSSLGEHTAGLTSGGGNPRRTAAYYESYPGLHPERWSPSFGIPGSGGRLPEQYQDKHANAMALKMAGRSQWPGGGGGIPGTGGWSPGGGWHIGASEGEGLGQISGMPGYDGPAVPDFNLPDDPNVAWEKMPKRIQIGDTVVDFTDPTQLQMAMIGYYGQKAQTMAGVYGQQLNYMQTLQVAQMQQEAQYRQLEMQELLARGGWDHQKQMQADAHSNRMGAFGEIMGAFGGSGRQSLPGMGEQEWNRREGAALAENAADSGKGLLGMMGQMGGRGLAGNAAMGPMAQHTRAMADTADANAIRDQRMKHQLGLMQGIGGILGAV